jgi:hypothetical protein
MGAAKPPPSPALSLRCGALGTDSVYDELFGLHHRAFRHLDVGHALSEEAVHAPALCTHEVGVVSRTLFPGGGMSAVSPNPVSSLNCMHDCPALQGEESSINSYPVERSYFFPPPQIGVGYRAAQFQQVAEDYGAHWGDPEGNASQKGVCGCLVFGCAHRCPVIECN